MVLYLCIIGIATLMDGALCAIFASPVFGFSPWLAFVFAAAATLTCFTIDLIIAFAVRAIPAKHFGPDKKWFKELKHERRFYEGLKIRKWKDKIPEIGKLVKKLDKTKVEDTGNPEYLFHFLCEIGYAEVMHFWSLFLGFLTILVFPLQWWYLFGFPIAAVNFFLQLLPVFVQRYNRPKLLKAYQRALKKKIQIDSNLKSNAAD